MAQVKVRVTRMYFDGEKRVREGELIFVDEKEIIPDCHERLDGKKVKESVPEKKEKKPLPGQGPLTKQKTEKEIASEAILDEESPI